jgi:hypothetical protein
MERFAKLMVLSLGIGVVAVVLGFPPRHTFAAEGTTSKSLITLIATGSNAYSTTPYLLSVQPNHRTVLDHSLCLADRQITDSHRYSDDRGGMSSR